ncbi:MAG: hypothetical protein AAF620_13695 [Bacteroidota bacterium]
MNTVFEYQLVEDFKNRIERIDESAEALWGKMNLKQMLKHCIENEKLMLREKKLKDVFIGRLFGQMALKSDIKDEKPLGKNSPTHPDLKMKGVVVLEDVETLKSEWKHLLEKYLDISTDHYNGFVHPFFRKMNYAQVGIWASKHINHHLSQFGF